ncbi:GTPase HflX [Maridesulfovibrio hydrothermalis]|uniref:GTPase HflX n=1 Tax=Maridesulfovibrio hydrothermalis AM13 = DSM 14728 TaxID=1121451 RepID=L0REV6_9BACT|nr:GTPase HflX [Maridesulfovibrio hydrothermalis]CCO25289.1 GTPase HflX [Maridesulfovibrio hydrothermalis AM13 = DSM 14728]
MKRINRLADRRYSEPCGFSNEQARELALLSHEIGRQIGLLVDRQGRPEMILVGDPSSIYIPELPRARQSEGRLRGLRLLHTHISGENLSEEDLMDMVFLRLDSVTVVASNPHGEPDFVQYAYLLPPESGAKPYEQLPPVRWDRADIDLPAQIKALEDEFRRADRTRDTTDKRERAIVVSVSQAPKSVQERSLDELEDLAETAGLKVEGRLIQRIRKVNPKFIMGKGKLAELEVLALQADAEVILFDQELSAGQMRNLAKLTERKILDRTQLILDIFAQHATTKAGKLQVEMAQLKYTMPRLVGKNRALSRLMGGIGGRGPGETKLEVDRRRIKDKLTKLGNELKKVSRQRGFTRDRRARAGVPVVSLVGYTNAGKSTLLNTLTNSGVLAENKLFATLDPTSRRIRFPSDQELILTDTVGFIRQLPKELKEAFRATLEELEAADVLLHVADVSHPEVGEQIEAVQKIIEDMELQGVTEILVLNKWDQLNEEERELVSNTYPHGIPASAITRRSLSSLVEVILEEIDKAVTRHR